MSSWKRPKDVPYPSVWARFQGKVSEDGKPPLWYTIQDVPEHLFEDLIQHMTRYFLVREITCATLGLLEDPVSLAEFQSLWREKLSQKMSIVALVDGDEEPSKRIAGCNMLHTITLEDQQKSKNVQYNGRVMQKQMLVFDDLYNRENIFEKFNVDVYMSAIGLSVAPQYHQDNVGYHLLMARTPLCRATGLRLMVTYFSSAAAVHEAFKAGFKLLQYESTKTYKLNGQVLYPRLNGQLVLTAKTVPELMEK
ncbi:uncharacterized protein LOC111051849 [Nilaparvata lugens]|uniref:uncharacterized protein LOC111051849 n=1 Tax=Nilaparvata lugens TaxID=108931 RepID=UPI000B98C84E|nr:uncharacterized protein LOC111051849 [Nilaparvata lugens]XP_039280209.1 uncharacterized protein LOC111051849 [Nilaparvata lugens]